jgi:hypothetical protein
VQLNPPLKAATVYTKTESELGDGCRRKSQTPEKAEANNNNNNVKEDANTATAATTKEDAAPKNGTYAENVSEYDA